MCDGDYPWTVIHAYEAGSSFGLRISIMGGSQAEPMAGVRNNGYRFCDTTANRYWLEPWRGLIDPEPDSLVAHARVVVALNACGIRAMLMRWK